MKFTILIDSSLVTLTIPSVYAGCREEDSLKNNAFSLYDLPVFGHILAQESRPDPARDQETNNLVDLSIVIITMHSVCLNHVPE